MVFQGEEGNKTYPLRNKGQRDWYSEIEKEESSRRLQNRGRPGEGRELGGRGGGGGVGAGVWRRGGGGGGSAFIVPLYSDLVMEKGGGREGEGVGGGGEGEGVGGGVGGGGSAFIVPLYCDLVMKMPPLIMTGFTATKQPPVTNTSSFYGTNSCAYHQSVLVHVLPVH